MLAEWQKERLKKQWGRLDCLEQFAIVHLQDKHTKWDWYFLSLSPDETLLWAIIDGWDLEIAELESEFIADMNFIFYEGITMDEEFLPIRAQVIWQSLKKKRAMKGWKNP